MQNSFDLKLLRNSDTWRFVSQMKNIQHFQAPRKIIQVSLENLFRLNLSESVAVRFRIFVSTTLWPRQAVPSSFLWPRCALQAVLSSPVPNPFFFFIFISSSSSHALIPLGVPCLPLPRRRSSGCIESTPAVGRSVSVPSMHQANPCCLIF